MTKTFRLEWMKVFSIFILGIFASINVLAQDGSTIDVKGVVQDEFGPVVGANVIIKGTTTGTATDLEGRFSLKTPKDATLVVSFVGYKPQEIPVSSNLIIRLKEDSELLDEVVVIGYGSVKKSDATGSVTAIKIDDMNKGLATSPQDILGGKIAGVSVMSSGGRPGEGASIRIRGGSSLTATNEPLVIIDGVIISNDLAGTSNFLSTINPADIETFTVLKDASATAIYGSRASNGVILITTKKGVAGSPKVAYNGSFSVSTKRNKVDVLDGDEYRNLIADRFTGTSQYDEVMKMIGKEKTDWQDEIYQTAFGTDHNASIYGSIGKTMPYRASLGYTNEEGILRTSKFERVTTNLSLAPSFFDNHLTFNINAKGMFAKTRFAETGAIGSAVFFDPTQPVYNGSKWGGYFAWVDDSDGGVSSIAGKNPLAMLDMQKDQAYAQNLIGNIQTDYKLHFFPDIRLNLNLGMDIASTHGQNFKNPWSPTEAGRNNQERGSRKRFENFKNNQLLELYAQYNKDVESIKSKFDVMAGYSWQHYKKISDDYSHYLSMRNLSDLERTDDGNNYKFLEYYLVSVFGRFNYTFNDKYLFTFTMRNDGSSRFADGNRWGLYPSLAFAWKMKEETFLKDATVLSDLKLRVGWGKTGQQDLNDDKYYYPSTPSYLIGKDKGYYPMGLNPDGTINWVKLTKPSGYNKSLKWETTATWNVGIDYGFLNNRISGALDVYFRKTTDLLNKEAPTIAGVSLSEELPMNIGDLENNGIEFSIDAKPIVTKDFMWNVGFNISYNKSKITKLSNNEDPDFTGIAVDDTGGDGSSRLQRYITGYAPRTFYMYEQVYDQGGKPIEGVYVDRNGDGTIDDKDLYLYKKPAADVLMGFSSKVVYKEWDFGFNGRVSLGNYVFNATAANAANMSNTALYANNASLSNKPQSALNTNFFSQQVLSDYYVQNGSFLKIDNITLGYTLDKVLKNKLKARVYATVQNPIVITKYDGLDPEVTDGRDYNFYPRPLRFMLGFNLNF